MEHDSFKNKTKKNFLIIILKVWDKLNDLKNCVHLEFLHQIK